MKRLFALVLLLSTLGCSSNPAPPRPPIAPPQPPPHLSPIDNTGPLQICGNLFCLPGGPPIFLSGVSTGFEFQGGEPWEPIPQPFDWPLFLSDLDRWGANYLRLWMVEHTLWDPDNPRSNLPATPMPWLRTGPGLAADGLPRFDLSQPDPAYYALLRRYVEDLNARGIYTSVMLFQGVSLWTERKSGGHKLPKWKTLATNPRNNIQGWPVEEPGWETHRATSGPVWEIQRKHIRLTVQALEGLPNVLLEVANEDRHGTAEWQYAVIDEAKRAMAEELSHAPWPVGMTYRQGDGTNAELCASPADWYSPKVPRGRLASAPCPGKASLLSDDHFHVYNTKTRYPGKARELGHAGFDHLHPAGRYFHRTTDRAEKLERQHEPMGKATGAAAGVIE